MKLPNIFWEKHHFKNGHQIIAGADEVGRGAWAGPVVAAAIVLAPAEKLKTFHRQITKEQILICDSKQIKFQKRRQVANWLKQNASAWGIGESPPALINRIGLGKATQSAFRKALINAANHLASRRIDFLLVDAFYIPRTKTLNRARQQPIVKGDSQVLSIAAASIIAKDYRDLIMRRLSHRHPIYGWGQNKGYGTPFHQQAITQNGTTRHHRHQFVNTWLKKLT